MRALTVVVLATLLAGCGGASPPAAPSTDAPASRVAALPGDALAYLSAKGVKTPPAILRAWSVSPRTPWDNGVALITGNAYEVNPTDDPAGSINLQNGAQGTPPGPGNLPYAGLRFAAITGMTYLLRCEYAGSGGPMQSVFVRVDDGTFFGKQETTTTPPAFLASSDESAFDGPAVVYFGSLSTGGTVRACSLYELDLTP